MIDVKSTGNLASLVYDSGCFVAPGLRPPPCGAPFMAGEGAVVAASKSGATSAPEVELFNFPVPIVEI